MSPTLSYSSVTDTENRSISHKIKSINHTHNNNDTNAEFDTDNRLNSHAQSSNIQQHSTYARITKSSIPSKRQAILLPSIENITIIEYAIYIGRLIGPDKIISASKIAKKRVCVYLSSEKVADDFVKNFKTITINNQILPVRKLISPSKKLILSNIHTCIPNSVILDALQRNQSKPTSSIFELHISVASYKFDKSELEKYAHVTSFRRGVFIEFDENTIISDSLLIQYEEDSFRIFINDSELRCHLCQGIGHNSSQCTETPHFFEQSTNNTDTVLLDLSKETVLDANAGIKRPLSQTDSTITIQESELRNNLKCTPSISNVTTPFAIPNPRKKKSKKSKKMKIDNDESS
ncbi:hypothetical protein PGB90_009770 [Kerria lacca]